MTIPGRFVGALPRRGAWLAAAGVGVVAAAAGAAFWWQGRPERHLAAAEAAVADGAPADALEWLTLPAATPATRERALILRARVAVLGGDPVTAARALDGVDPAGPRAAEFAHWKGRTLYAAGQPLLARRWLAEAARRRPDDADTLRWLAAAAYDVGDRSTVVAALEAVLRLDPGDARAGQTLGRVYLENAEYGRARVAFERSLAADRAQPDVRLELADALLKLGDAAGAARQLDLCRGRVPAARHAELLAEARRSRGDVAGFRTAVAAGLASDPGHPGLLLHQARLDQADGRPADALDRLDRALAADPFRAEALYHRGLVLRRLGRDDDGRRDLDRAAALNRGLAEMSALNDQAARRPHDADVRFRLGRLCADLGKPDLAASWYRAALACAPDHPAARAALDSLRPGRRARTGAGAGPRLSP